MVIKIMFYFYLSLLVFFYSGALAFGSERLDLFILTKNILKNKIISAQDLIQFNNKSQSLGFEGISNKKQSDYTILINKAIYPTFAYSDNINAGNLTQTIQVGDFSFVGEKNAVAKKGIIMGGGFYLGIKKPYSRGRYIDINLKASLAAAPAHDWLQVRNETIIACSKNHLKEWIFFDACASWAHNKKEYSDTINTSISAKATKLFMTRRGFHESSFIVERYITDEYQQMQGSLVLNSLLSNVYKTNIFVIKGEPVKGMISLNYALGISFNRLINNKPLKVSFNQSFYNGVEFLGIQRKDTSKKIVISYPINSGLNVSIGYVKNYSTIKSFSHNGPLVSLSLPFFKF